MYLVKFSEISLSQDIVQRQLLIFDICVSHQQLKNLRVFAYRKIYLAKISWIKQRNTYQILQNVYKCPAYTNI